MQQELEETNAKFEKERELLREQITQQQAALDRVHVRNAVNALQLNEAETRKLIIDQYLLDAGWNLNDTESVRQEYRVDDQGYEADYVLFDKSDGRPLAIIEAKKTAVDPIIGQEQARQYAQALHAKDGQFPIIFYTNGHDIHLWDSERHFPPRQVYGFYSEERLRSLIAYRDQAKPALSSQEIDQEIIDRPYQIEAVNAVLEQFQKRQRKALIVQATGTGKTRVAIALSKVLKEAGWCRRILFLCDRRELRKQAKQNFERFMESEVVTVITSVNVEERNNTLHFATYQTMLDCLYSFDIGYFDLIIADESHRSIYNRYGEILRYFDAYKVGLTATPKSQVDASTYTLFGCEGKNPTFDFSYEEAIKAKSPYLSTFRVKKYRTGFLKSGIKYDQLTAEQRKEIEEQELNPEDVCYDPKELDKQIFNKDTNRKILQNLMDEGLRVNEGSRVGKTIIFARNHNHAVLLCKLFYKMFPQYGGAFCQVVDNYNPRAEDLIADFKGEGQNNDLVIAISVDMLDTGIDVPEILNLVFAKPVFSYIKFWQMIGRGTRLCENLFGPGKHKSEFLIFDHWGNFEYFDELAGKEDAEALRTKSLQQLLFENRIALAKVAVEMQNVEAFDLAKKLILEDLAALPEKSVSIHSCWKEINYARQEETICDPSCGTGGFLVKAYEYLLKENTSPDGIIDRDEANKPIDPIYTGNELEKKDWKHVHNTMFYGFDFDATMLRIASMNLILHELENPNIHYCDSLTGAMPERFPELAANRFDVILANPPFKGKLNPDAIHSSLTGLVKTKDSELLFLALMLRMLKQGGRCGVVVPDGVLFGSSNAHKDLRRILVEKNQLEAVISLPSGVFKPYAGVSTAVLLFTKDGQTENVFFYDVKADGYSLDDKRQKIAEDDLPDVVKQWAKWKSGNKPKAFADRTKACFVVPRSEITENDCDLSLGRYKEHVHEEIQYDPPKKIIKSLRKLEADIADRLTKLEGMLK